MFHSPLTCMYANISDELGARQIDDSCMTSPPPPPHTRTSTNESGSTVAPKQQQQLLAGGSGNFVREKSEKKASRWHRHLPRLQREDSLFNRPRQNRSRGGVREDTSELLRVCKYEYETKTKKDHPFATSSEISYRL